MIVVRLAIINASECWAIDRKMEPRVSFAEMRMLRWIDVVVEEINIRNEYTRGSIFKNCFNSRWNVRI